VMRTGKIQMREDLVSILPGIRKNFVKIGFTNGCFDIIHVGHVKYLEQAKKECDILVVAVNSDNSVKRIKGAGRPVNPEGARMEVLAALEAVDYVTLFEEDTPLNLIKELIPDVLFKGGDWKENDIVGGDIVRENGGIVRSLHFMKGYSTTRIIDLIRG